MRTKDILLVQDCTEQLDVLSLILESQGFEVTAAANGCQALEQLENNEYRIIVTDFNMPQMNGIELAARARERHPGTRVVLVTADAVPGILEEAENAGVSEIFSKPADLKMLVASISSALTGRPGQPVPCRRPPSDHPTG